MPLSTKFNTLQKIQKTLKPNPLIISTNIILCVFHYWLIVLKGRYDGTFVDSILRNSSHEKLKVIIFHVIVYYIAYNLLQKFRGIVNQQFSQHMIIQIKRKVARPQTTDLLDLCLSSINLLVTPLYDIIRIIIISYIMYSISQYLFFLVLCLTPFKILNIFSTQFFKKEESVRLSWRVEFCKGILDKILQVIVIYCTGLRFIDNEISIEDLVIFGSQLITLNRLLPAVKTDFEGLEKALALFERILEEMEIEEQSEQEQFGQEEAFEENSGTVIVQWKFWSSYLKVLNKNIKKMRQLFSQTVRKTKFLTWNLLNLGIWKKGAEQIGRQEQGFSINIEKRKRELANGDEGSPRKRDRIMMNT